MQVALFLSIITVFQRLSGAVRVIITCLMSAWIHFIISRVLLQSTVTCNHYDDRFYIIFGTMPGTNMAWLNSTYNKMCSMTYLNDSFINNSNGLLNYSAVPLLSGSYNSNSYTYSLLRYAGIPTPNLSTGPNGGYPGWGKLIPVINFRRYGT